MDIQLRKEMVTINETLMHDTMQVLVQNDIIVPDIKSDMSKILQIDSCAMVEKVEVGDKRANIDGSVALTILYVPEGDEKPVCSINTTIPFSALAENSMISSGSHCIVRADAYHVEFSMLNSRKLSVKVIVELDIRCIRENNVEIVCDASADTPIEKQSQDFWIYNLVNASNTKIGVRETLDFPSGKPSAASVLKTDAKICNKDMRLVSGKIVVKGSILLCSLYVSEDNNIEFMEHEIPFTEVLDAEGANENCMCELELNICRAESMLRADTNGNMRLLDVDIIIDADTNVTENTSMNALCDCFCASQKLLCETKPFCFDVLCGKGQTSQAFRATLSLPESAPELVSVYNLVSKPYISDITLSDGKAMVTGSIDCYILYLSNSVTTPISTQKAQIDFEIPIEIDSLNNSMDCDITVEALHQSYNITMTGEIEVRVSLIFEAKAISKKTAQLCVNVLADDDAPLDVRHGIIVYFVRPGDTLWKISKKYNVSPQLIAQINGLENPDVLNVGQRLLIPNMVR